MRLEVQGLKKTYNKLAVVDDVNFYVESGEIISLLGSNGAGKTTSFYMLIGLVRPDYGKVIFNNKDITHIPMHQRALLGIGYLPQENSIFRGLTAENNILAAIEHLNLSTNETKIRVENALKEMKVEHIRGNYAYTLSGGERRRIEIARCLALNPRFIIFDEPFAGVDPVSILDMQKIMQSLAEKGFGIIINDHNVRETLLVSHRAYIMHRSKIIAQGNPEKIKSDKLARQYYFGTD